MVHLCGRRYAQRAGQTTEIRVCSNQPEVTLYLNGSCIGVQRADKMFVFTVALRDGFNVLKAVAGPVQDAMTLEKVEREPEIYVLPEVNERREGVANWFSTTGSMDLHAPMTFPAGSWNVRYTMEELAACPEAFEIVKEAAKLATGFQITPGEGMWSMLKNMTPESMLRMAGGQLPDGFLESLNVKLTAIARKE